MPLNPKEIRHQLSKLQQAREESFARTLSDDILNSLLRQLEELRELANGYPHNPISGSVWLEGKELAELCDELAIELCKRGFPQREELATRLATGMACQVMGHYPEQIFPRVLRNSICREKIDQVDAAIGGYEAVVSDFRKLELEELLTEETLDESQRTILTCVKEAIDRLAELQPADSANLETLHMALMRRLQEP